MKGLLLLNLGTPESPEPNDVGNYLSEFLMDPYVIDMPYFLRWLLVKRMIVPKRKHESSRLYKKIWTEEGSPLLIHLRELAVRVTERVPPNTVVAIGMRYGEPSIQSGLKLLQDSAVNEVTVISLYPQYAESTMLSSRLECEKQAKNMGFDVPFKFVEPFFQRRDFILPYVKGLRSAVSEFTPDHVLMSFHGLPERHIRKTDLSGGRHCLVKDGCCDEIIEVNRDCYRAQCYATARALALESGLAKDRYTVSFQSRLGRGRWIQPYTEESIRELARQGVRKLLVTCPSFVADCLETLEEIKIRGAEVFHESGGTEFHVLSSLNSDPIWAASIVKMFDTATFG